MIKKTAFATIGLLTASLLLQDCKGPVSPNDVEAGIISVTAGCQFLKGVTENETVIAICATVEEIAFIASLFTPLLDTFPDAESCTYLPPPQRVCLTDKQIGQGIISVVDQRRSRLWLDAAGQSH